MKLVKIRLRFPLLSLQSFYILDKFCTRFLSYVIFYLYLLLPSCQFFPFNNGHLFPVSIAEAFTLHRQSHSHSQIQQQLLLRVMREARQNLLFDVPSTKDEFEIAQVKFLTPLRSRRDLNEREIHILQVKRPSQNSTLTIHLAKKTTLLSPLLTVTVWDGDTNVTEIPPEASQGSVFSGTVTSTPHSDSKEATNTNRYKGNYEGQGQAALSVCNDHAGFCGLIVTDGEHLILQPHPRSESESDPLASEATDDNKSGPSPEVDHVILRVDPATSTSTSTCSSDSDELRVPLEKLIEASALSTLESHIHRQHNRNRDHFEPLSDDEKVHSYPASLLTPIHPGQGSDQEITIITSPTLTHMNYFHPDAFGGAGSGSSGPSAHVVKSMALNNKKTVEIAVFTDEDLYITLRKKFPKDTVKKIKDYVITMINSMDLLYQHNSLGADIEFSLVHLEIMKKYPSKLNKNGGKAMKYLTSFCDYAGEKNVNSDMWDHALLLTGMDLREDETSATAGLAWAGTMCYRYYSCSVSEGSSFGAAYIITHEIGHSLGMEHDGNGVSKSCDRDKFIMSPTTGPGKVEWSPCSKKNLNDFLQYGTSELRNSKSAHKPLCLSETSMKGTPNKIEISSGISPLPLSSLPGQKYNASQQCMLAMGVRFKPVLRKGNPPFDNICWMLYCGNGTHAVSTHPALEGSRCDDGKYCRNGKCVIKLRN